MNTPVYPRHCLTAEVVLRVDQLYTAAKELEARAAKQLELAQYDRWKLTAKAAARFNTRAYGLLIDALTPHELKRLVALHKAQQEQRAA